MRHAKYRRPGRTWIALGTALLLAGLTGDGLEEMLVVRRYEPKGAALDLAYPLPEEMG